MSAPRHPLCLMIDSFARGGTEHQFAEIVTRLDRDKYNLTIGCLKRCGEFYEQVRAAGIAVHEFPLQGWFSPRAQQSRWKWVRLALREKIELVHSFDLYTNFFAAPLARLAGVPVVITSLRHQLSVCTPAQRWGLRRTFLFSDCVTTNSEAVRASLLGEGLPADRVRVTRNGVDLERFIPNGHHGEMRIQLSGRSDPLFVGVIGNLRSEKDHRSLLAAVPEVVERVPRAQFLLVGTGPLEAELRREAAASPGSEQIHFLGYRTDIAELLGAIDLVVLPTLSESLPNAVLEAMSAGRAVIASDVGGCREVIEPDRTGVLVPPRNPSALAAQIVRLLEHTELREEMGRAARRRAETEFALPGAVKRLEEIYDELLEKKLGAS